MDILAQNDLGEAIMGIFMVIGAILGGICGIAHAVKASEGYWLTILAGVVVFGGFAALGGTMAGMLVGAVIGVAIQLFIEEDLWIMVLIIPGFFVVMGVFGWVVGLFRK